MPAGVSSPAGPLTPATAACVPRCRRWSHAARRRRRPPAAARCVPAPTLRALRRDRSWRQPSRGPPPAAPSARRSAERPRAHTYATAANSRGKGQWIEHGACAPHPLADLSLWPRACLQESTSFLQRAGRHFPCARRAAWRSDRRSAGTGAGSSMPRRAECAAGSRRW